MDLAEHRRNQTYNHPSSKRARDLQRNGKPDPISLMQSEHRGELADLASRQRSEALQLDAKHNAARARHGDRVPAAMPEQHKRERETLMARQRQERQKLSDRHAHDVDTALKTHGAL